MVTATREQDLELAVGDVFTWTGGKHPGERVKITKVSAQTCEYEILGRNANKGKNHSKRCQVRRAFLATCAKRA